MKAPRLTPAGPLLPLALAACLSCTGGHPASQAEAAPTKTDPSRHLLSGESGSPVDAGPRRDSDAAPTLATDAAQKGAVKDALVATWLAKVTEVRGLTSRAPVPGRTLERKALLARVRAHVDREIPDAAIEHEALINKLLGMVPTKFDYKGALFALLEAQLAGFYEPADGTMYLAGDLDKETADATLAHELVHALQDQHFDLKSRSQYAPGQGDKSTSNSCLAEGDATSAMLDTMLETMMAGSGKTAIDLPDDLFRQLILGGMEKGPGADAPHAMRASLVAPYIDGTLFVNGLRRRGGWNAVDAAWKSPPSTTEHPPPRQVRRPRAGHRNPGLPLCVARGRMERRRFGQLRRALSPHLSRRERRPASSGDDGVPLGGDRGILLSAPGKHALAWRIRYDPDAPKGAEAAFSKLRTALATSAGAHPTSGTTVCFPRPGNGALGLARAQNDLVLVVGPTNSDSAGAWTPAVDCAAVTTWMKEIIAHR